jgi:hypothetical protein
VLANLFDGNNMGYHDENIWLTALLTDLDKIEKGRENSILI